MSDSVGYTNDGMVYMRIENVTSSGEPLQTTILWKPKYAKEMGGFLIDAADACVAKKEQAAGKG